MADGKPGRPKGKHSDPSYIQVTAYLTKKTYRAVKIRIAELDVERSDVIEALLQEWLERTKPQRKRSKDSGRS